MCSQNDSRPWYRCVKNVEKDMDYIGSVTYKHFRDRHTHTVLKPFPFLKPLKTFKITLMYVM